MMLALILRSLGLRAKPSLPELVCPSTQKFSRDYAKLSADVHADLCASLGRPVAL